MGQMFEDGHGVQPEEGLVELLRGVWVVLGSSRQLPVLTMDFLIVKFGRPGVWKVLGAGRPGAVNGRLGKGEASGNAVSSVRVRGRLNGGVMWVASSSETA